MPLVTTKEMFEKALKGGYAIGAFNVDPYTIVAGNPARIIKKRFSADDIIMHEKIVEGGKSNAKK